MLAGLNIPGYVPCLFNRSLSVDIREDRLGQFFLKLWLAYATAGVCPHRIVFYQSPLYLLRQGLSLNLDFTISSRLAVQQVPRVCLPPFFPSVAVCQCMLPHLPFMQVHGEHDSCHHACMANALPLSHLSTPPYMKFSQIPSDLDPGCDMGIRESVNSILMTHEAKEKQYSPALLDTSNLCELPARGVICEFH